MSKTAPLIRTSSPREGGVSLGSLPVVAKRIPEGSNKLRCKNSHSCPKGTPFFRSHPWNSAKGHEEEMNLLLMPQGYDKSSFPPCK